MPVALALSTGPEQVEYASYESADSTDMVNLITGDFNYTMPIIQVPGPEGSFTVPLFYHAGITPEQDASWTGLGWNINVGCITRDIVGYHDDAYDDPIAVNVTDPGGRGWVKNYIFYKRTWDTQKGYGGAITLADIVGAQWNSSGLTGGTALGLNFNKNGVKGYWMDNVFKVANVAMTVASVGSSIGASAGGQAAKTTALDIAMTSTQIGTGLFQGYLSQGIFSSRYFNWDQSTSVSHLGFRTDYKYWLDDTRIERAFGALYLGSLHKSDISHASSYPDFNDIGTNWPRIYDPNLSFGDLAISKGFKQTSGSTFTTSDMFTYVDPYQNYGSHVGATHLSYDQFNVMSAGVSGNISPYRFEIGSLAQPKRYSLVNYCHNLVPFIEEDGDVNKVQFYYNGQFSNNYLHHYDESFGIKFRTIDYSGPDYPDAKYVAYDITNDKLKNTRVETDNSRLKNKKIVSGKNIEWFTNSEIASGVARSKGFIDTENVKFSRPFKGIGGFSITKEDGVTYHYALPVYKTREVDLVGKKGEEELKYSRSVNESDVAITWLLTAITGPDFVDRGQSGLLDSEDWGYWVKFNYNLSAFEYAYRSPYYGYFDDGTSLQYSQGERQQYYLNSVETRSHIALFIKGVRTDGLSSYLKKNDPAFGHDTETGMPTPTPPLYLDEIILLTKPDFATLTNLGFHERANSSLGFPGLTDDNGTLGLVYDIGDVAVAANYRTFINTKALRRVKFVYETDETKKLCKKALNSFTDPGNPPAVDEADMYAGRQGKLTLRRLQFFGKNSVKVFPDYKFEYAYNPDYNKDHWDGWGYFNPGGTNDLSTHKASQADLHGTAWSLTGITLPTGGQITVNHERDSYASISGEKVRTARIDYGELLTSFVYNGPATLPSNIPIVDPRPFQVGELVRVEGEISYAYNGQTYRNTYSKLLTIKSIGEHSVTVDHNYVTMDYYYIPMGVTIDVSSNFGSVYKLSKAKKGGDIRVSEIVSTNEFGESLKTKYTYLNDEGFSSGVVAKEPELIKDSMLNPDNYGLDNLYDYPSTPVLYSKVTVHSGYNRQEDSYTAKQVFEFETPKRDMIERTASKLLDERIPGFGYVSNNVSIRQYLNKVAIKTARIGKLKSIKTLDKDNKLVESSSFQYTETPPGGQGKYTSGSILSEFTTMDGPEDPYAFKLTRTVKTYYPYALAKITHTKDGFVDTKEYKSWDWFTGLPLVTETQSTSRKVWEETVPAYRVQYALGSTATMPYATMGLKGFDVAHKNMLSQNAAFYAYMLDKNNRVLGLLGAGVQTWKDNWDNYRVYNATSLSYGNGSEGPKIWRKHVDYVWLGDYSRYRSDGSRLFTEADKFDFNPASANLLWKKMSSVDRYDHYSMPLTLLQTPGGDASGINYAVKMGYGDKYQIAAASNAKYEEIAFSSAEDLKSNNYFGGEVKKGSGTLVSGSAHTGVNSISLSSGYAFIYNTANLEANKKYRVGVWTNSVNGRIYYKINNGAVVLSEAPVMQKKVGNWYLLDMDIAAQAASFSLEVGVTTTLGSVLFDDFRFQPADAVMTCYVYNPNTLNTEYILDNNNLYTRYEYNDLGFMIKTYEESLKYGEKLKSEMRNDYRRFHIDE
jgi:hypothetical protein